MGLSRKEKDALKEGAWALRYCAERLRDWTRAENTAERRRVEKLLDYAAALDELAGA